jgi:hypothetical protein
MKKKKKNNNRFKLIFLYYAIALTLLITGITFSQYRMTANGKGKINTSKFAFKITDELSNVSLNLTDTLTANLYSKNKLVPGSNGVLQLEMDFSEIETATRYSVTLDEENSQIPENMKLYTDNIYNVEFSGYTGITELGTDKITRNIYWKWNYTTVDETSKWMKSNIVVALKIQAQQRTN